jgi:hypothetical protein
MAEQAQMTGVGLIGVHPFLPAEPFYSACGTNWGVPWFDPDSDLVVRRDWPFPSPGPYPSLAEASAKLLIPGVGDELQRRWLRYYGSTGQWNRLSYGFALNRPRGYFHDQIVFIGNQPATTVPNDGERDKFSTPYTRWNKEAVGGVDLVITGFLNLINHDGLCRAPIWIEFCILVLTGTISGGLLCRLRVRWASVMAVTSALAVMLIAVSYAYYFRHWIAWLSISAGQVPLALCWTCLVNWKSSLSSVGPRDRPEKPPEIEGYELFDPPFGEGAYGKVWIAKSNKGEWKAVKVVYIASFDGRSEPYEREFQGVCRYYPISGKHPGLVHINFISEKLPDKFYYIMELGDSIEPGWKREPAKFKPDDLASRRLRMPGKRLSVADSVQVGIAASEALHFLHSNGLTHRDIKPQNVIFFNGVPKLADPGLVAEIRPPDKTRTSIGTPGYMPPPSEAPGTPQADVYALGMLLYVLSTGREPGLFPDFSTSLVENIQDIDYLALNKIILKACHPDPNCRYSSAFDMNQALIHIQSRL